MKKKIEVEIDIPYYLNDELLSLISLLSPNDINHIAAYICGMLVAQRKITAEDAAEYLKKIEG